MMKLYNANFSPNALRVRAVVYELGLMPEIIDVDLSKGENRTPAYLALNPSGKVPTLVDGDVVIWESRAINAYLASQKPERNLYPLAPALRSSVDQWSYWQAIHLGPAMQKIAFERVQKKLFGRGEPDDNAIAGELKTVADLLPVLDAALSGRDWICGTLSIADFALASTFMLRGPAGLTIATYPYVAAWLARLEARPSWQKAVTPFLDLLRARGVELGS
jgi:glutathione S-transferase